MLKCSFVKRSNSDILFPYNAIKCSNSLQPPLTLSTTFHSKVTFRFTQGELGLPVNLSFAPTSLAHCLISYRGGLGTSLCIMGYGTQHPHSRKEHIELYNILKFGVNQANIRRNTAIQKLKNLLRNVRNAGHTSGVPYIS